MEKYKFKVRKIKENIIEIEAENKSEVLKKLAGYLATKDKSFCEKISKTKEGFYILLNEISSETKKTIIDDEDEINEDVVRYLLSDNEENLKKYYEDFFEENEENEQDIDEENSIENEETDEEIDEYLPRVYTEICCEKCRKLHTYWRNCTPFRLLTSTEFFLPREKFDIMGQMPQSPL